MRTSMSTRKTVCVSHCVLNAKKRPIQVGKLGRFAARLWRKYGFNTRQKYPKKREEKLPLSDQVRPV